MNILQTYKQLLFQLDNELKNDKIRFTIIYNIKNLLIQTSKKDFTSGINVFNVINATIKTLKTENLIMLNQVLKKIKQEQVDYYISEDEES
jgi:hypothetical protein